jgi:hypothetical protein
MSSQLHQGGDSVCVCERKERERERERERREKEREKREQGGRMGATVTYPLVQ